jgi:hypothetical protein
MGDVGTGSEATSNVAPGVDPSGGSTRDRHNRHYARARARRQHRHLPLVS